MRCNIPYTVIGTGSTGNAVLLNNRILVDCGVPYRDITPYTRQIQLVLLTHCHGDHFNPATVRRLAAERPSLRFAGGAWLLQEMVDAGISKRNIDVLECGKMYNYGIASIIPVRLNHNVPNCGYKIHFARGKVFYATDTNDLNGIFAKDYDLYLVEANYEDEEIRRRIKQKETDGEFAYEKNVLHNHLSKEKCDAWIYANAGCTSEYVYLHQHRDRTGA